MADWFVRPLHEDPSVQSHCSSHLPVRCTDFGSLPEADQAIWAVSSTLLALHPWHQMARPRVERRSPQESQPAQHRVHLALGAAALGWPHHKDGRRTHAKSSPLQRDPRRKERSWCSKKALQRQLAQAGFSHQSWQQEASDRDSWRSSVRKASCEFEAERHKAAKEKRRRQKERAASLPSSFQTFVCPKCDRGCALRMGLYSHQRACKNWPSTHQAILVCEEWAINRVPMCILIVSDIFVVYRVHRFLSWGSQMCVVLTFYVKCFNRVLFVVFFRYSSMFVFFVATFEWVNKVLFIYLFIFYFYYYYLFYFYYYFLTSKTALLVWLYIFSL